jgi:hypothetical protein
MHLAIASAQVVMLEHLRYAQKSLQALHVSLDVVHYTVYIPIRQPRGRAPRAQNPAVPGDPKEEAWPTQLKHLE